MSNKISGPLRKSIGLTLRFLLRLWVISILLTLSAGIIISEVFALTSIPWISDVAFTLGLGITALATTVTIHRPLWSTGEGVKNQNDRISLTLKKCIVVALRLLVIMWVVSLFLRVSAGVIVAKDFISTGLPWIGRIPLNVAIGITTLVVTVKLQWPIWPTDEETKSFFSFGSSSSSSQSTGTRSSSKQRRSRSGGQSQTDVYPWASGKSLSDMTEEEKDWFWADEEGYFEGDDQFNDDM